MRLSSLVLCLLLAPACKDKTSTDSGATDTGATSDDGDAGDTGTDGDSGSDSGGTDTGGGTTDDGFTIGPAVPDCTPATGDGDRVALSGVLLTDEGPAQGEVVYKRSTGEIACVGDCDLTGSDVVCTDGIIAPGLIDTHDHMQYNVLAPWQTEELYIDRYEWRSDGDYWDYREAYDDIEDAYECEIMKWAELRALASGATSAVGSSGGSCIEILARNLDEDESAHGLSGVSVDYSSSTVTDSYDDDDGAYFASALASGTYESVVNHVAEGVLGAGTGEITHMINTGMVGPGQVFVHATDATTEQLAAMSASGTGILWSPRSNLALYAATTPADIGRRMNVPVALGPDWTWSGSANPALEAGCAWDYLQSRGSPFTDREVVDMVTYDAATVLGVDGVIGGLFAGAKADIAVYDWSETPYERVMRATSDDVKLVIVDGHAIMGSREDITLLAESPGYCEDLSVCGEDRAVCVATDSSGDDGQSYRDIEELLASALGSVSMPDELAYAGELFPVWVCEDERPSCDVSAPADGDEDGDGIDDTGDVCPGVYDPLQTDHDSDGQGDACDPCPLNALTDDCAHDPTDIDGDGIDNDADDCPYLADDGTDSDGDGTPDGCDACPDYSNPDGGACPVSIPSIRDTSDPDHPAENAAVFFEGAVVTGVRDGGGYLVQDPDATEYGALYVYDGSGDAAAVGDVLSVEGTYVEYYGWTEITDPTITVTGTADTPAPIAIDDACAIATDGADAERYESMLVTLTDAVVTDSNPDDPSDYNEFEVDGCLRVDDYLCGDECWESQPDVDWEIGTLSGALIYSYGDSKLAPRSAEDVGY